MKKKIKKKLKTLLPSPASASSKAETSLAIAILLFPGCPCNVASKFCGLTPLCGINGSIENNSSEPLITSIAELVKVNGAVGLATPNLTGAIKESAVSQSSSTANLIKAWNILRHFISG